VRTKTRSAAALLLLAVVAAASVAGCGGGSSSSSSGGGGSSGDFASTAEAACTKANKEIAALGTPQQAEVSEYMEKTETVIEGLHQQVQAAAGDGGAEAAYAQGLAKAVPLLNEMTNAARNENFDAVRELSSGLVELDLGELAEAAELKACAEVPVSES
jgi:ABC-type glycerol-3-phosphate transport system substrate-binding protein